MNETAYPIVDLDLTWIGVRDKFTTVLPWRMRKEISVGDLVWVTDGDIEDIEPRLFRITELMEDGTQATYVLAE